MEQAMDFDFTLGVQIELPHVGCVGWHEDLVSIQLRVLDLDSFHVPSAE